MLNSHPEKTLKTHVAEVLEAANRVWASHSSRLRANFELYSTLARVIAFHDVGKGSKHFQVYIKNVSGWRGNKKKKAHTPFSTVAALHDAKCNGWTWTDVLAISVATAGHHSGFKTRHDLTRILTDGEWQLILEDQSRGIDWNGLCDAVNFPLSPFVSTLDFLDDLAEWFEGSILESSLDQLSVEDGVAFRLRCQLVHSILLEADKAYLKLDEADREPYRSSNGFSFDMQRLFDFTSNKSKDSPSPLDGLRQSARQSLSAGMECDANDSIFTMTLPTGSGKTLLAAHWALSQRERFRSENHTPPVIIVLPFLSVIEQTEKEYRAFLKGNLSVLPYHSLSVRDLEVTEPENALESGGANLGSESVEFMLDIWDADVIVTTFDQFLLALLSPKARYQMRFHSLCDAIVVMDEVQALPTMLWDIVNQCLAKLVTLGNFRLLAMSATQPGFLPSAREIIEHPGRFYASLARYELVLRHQDTIFLEDFIREVVERAKDWSNRRAMMVLNTRKSARSVRDALAKAGHEVIFLSADVTPKDRLASINRIKENLPCIVVATQCIEAGVDIDMDLVIRDFAPIDSIVQVAGRCNRHAKRPTERVEIVCLTDERERPFCQFIYDKVLLQETRSVLDEYLGRQHLLSIPESFVFELTNDFYRRVRCKKDLGQSITRAFSRWEEIPDIHELLRGKKGKQHTFVVIEEDSGLSLELQRVAMIEERWSRKRALRGLSGRLASISVAIYVKEDFQAERYATLDATDNFWLLKPGFYEPERGIDLDPKELADESEANWGTIF